jgi:Protein of unknown function (DUF2838)
MKNRLGQTSIDKLTFVIGVSYIWMTTLVLGRFPDWMPIYYFITTLPLVTIRWFIYSIILADLESKKWHFFLADLCYFVNALLVFLLFFHPSKHLFAAVFLLAHGPVAWAIFAWRNALVFHSLDKITSVAIHFAPALTLYTLRWFSLSQNPSNSFLPTFPQFAFNPEKPFEAEGMEYIHSYAAASVVYVIWQCLYYYFILILNREKVFDGRHKTSYTWLLSDYMTKKKSNPMTRMFKAVPEYFHSFLFIIVQFAYALITMAPAIIYYNNFWIHTIFIVFIVMLSIFNGADYYIEVFSRRYTQELARLERQASTMSPLLNPTDILDPVEAKETFVPSRTHTTIDAQVETKKEK